MGLAGECFVVLNAGSTVDYSENPPPLPGFGYNFNSRMDTLGGIITVEL